MIQSELNLNMNVVEPNNAKTFDNYLPPSWDEWFMRMVYLVAKKSKDTRTKIGSVVVNDDHRIISVGYNGFPVGVNDNIKVRYERPIKYHYFAHSEANSIFSAARIGISLNKSFLYTQGIPCTECTKAIIQAGITKVIVHEQWIENERKIRNYNDSSSKWKNHNEISIEMFRESEITLLSYNKILNEIGYLDGQIINV